jgi:hypothetical protein
VRRLEAIDDLLDRDDGGARRGKHRFLLHAGDPPQQHVPFAVRLLRVDDRHVRTDGRHGSEALAGERAVEEFHLRVVRRQIAAEVSAQHPERQT